jgi:antitoxin HicB
MIDRFAYPMSLTPASRFARGETGYVVACRDLPEINTQGESMAEALTNAADALDEAIAYRRRENLKRPSPSLPRRGEHVVAVPRRRRA